MKNHASPWIGGRGGVDFYGTNVCVMNDWIVKLLKLVYERYENGPKLLKTLVIIWICVFALILLLCSCTATLSIFRDNSGSSSTIESTNSPSTSVDSTKVNFNPQF